MELKGLVTKAMPETEGIKQLAKVRHKVRAKWNQMLSYETAKANMIDSATVACVDLNPSSRPTRCNNV
jgi:hypothetical protein